MIKGLIFDINGTLTDILTDENNFDLYRVLSNFLDYQGISIAPDEVKRLYFDINKKQRRQSGEEFPEFNVLKLFRELIAEHATEFTRAMPTEKQRLLPVIAAEVFRSASRFRLQLYDGVCEVLDELRSRYKLAAVSDGQSIWAIPELRSVGLLDRFRPIIISSDLGFRKPDARMFEKVLVEMDMTPDEVIFIGNDMYRDVLGAKNLDIPTVFFRSNQGDQRNAGADPDYIIYDFGQLPKAIAFIEKKLAGQSRIF